MTNAPPPRPPESEVVRGLAPYSPRIAAVAVAGPAVIEVTFADGAVRRRDLSGALSRPPFDALADPDAFADVRVAVHGHAVEWASGADLAGLAIYYAE